MSNPTFVSVKSCPRCPFFSYGHGDSACGVTPNVIPNSGAYATDGPPKNCPLRKGERIRIVQLHPEVRDES